MADKHHDMKIQDEARDKALKDIAAILGDKGVSFASRLKFGDIKKRIEETGHADYTQLQAIAKALGTPATPTAPPAPAKV